MKSNAGLKYIFYIALFLIFIIYRINFIIDSNGLYEIEYKTISIAGTTFPFGIIKQSVIKDYFMPVYYLIIHFFVTIFKNDTLIRVLNALIAFVTAVYLMKIGKKLLNKGMGIFLGLFLSINHFFLYYTNLIAPYCLNFLVYAILINYLIDFLRRPNKKNLLMLNIMNCVLIITDSMGIFFVISELVAFYLLFSKKALFKRIITPLALCSFGTFLAVFIILIIHYFSKINLMILDNYKSIGFNFNGLYLVINEFISPYLSFNTDPNQTKTTLGMLYSFFLNPKLSNINSLKILITLFYSSFLPIALMIYFTVKSYLKNYKFRILITIGLINLGIFLFFVLLEYAELEPIYLIYLYLIELLALFYGIFTIKDNFIRRIILFCLLAIQIVNPNLNSFNVSVYKNYPVGGLEAYKRDFGINPDDFIIMPYMSDFAKLRYKNLKFFDFDYTVFQKSKRDMFVKNIINKRLKTINKNNALYAYENYLLSPKTDEFFIKYFMSDCIGKTMNANNIIFIVEKMNSKPISKKGIYAVANTDFYNPRPVGISFNHASLKQNQSALLYNALKSRAFYDILSLLRENYYLSKIIEYENVNGEFNKIEEEIYDPYVAISSFNSDYAILVFKKKTGL